MIQLMAPEYRTSSFCSGGACVEVGAVVDGAVSVRDTKDRRQALTFGARDWAEFVDAVKRGEYDSL